MDLDGHVELVRRLMKLGYDEETASRYVSLVGDTPVLDEDDNTLVIDEKGQILARIKDYPW